MLEDKLTIPYLTINSRKELYLFCKAQNLPIYEEKSEESSSGYQFNYVPRTTLERTLKQLKLIGSKSVSPNEVFSLPDYLIKSKGICGETYTRWENGNATEQIDLKNGRIFCYENKQTEQVADQFQFDKKGNSTSCRFKKEFV